MSEYLINLVKYLKAFENQGVQELSERMSLSTTAKSKNFLLTQALIFSFEGKSIAKAKILKEKINIKTIQLKENNLPQEAMSFSPFSFTSIVSEEWETSDFKNYLSNPFVFVVFKFINGKNYLKKCFAWSIPLSVLNGEVKYVWEDTNNKIKNGLIIKQIKNGKVITWFLGESETKVCHVRPHGSNGSDVSRLPVRDKLTGYEHALKHSFWFNHSYIQQIVENN